MNKLRNNLDKVKLFSILKDSYYFYFSPRYPIPNGRWSVSKSNEERNIKAMLANNDSCGFGSPNDLKKKIDNLKETNFKKDVVEKKKYIIIDDTIVEY